MADYESGRDALRRLISRESASDQETQFWSKLDQSVAETFDWAASAAEARSTIEAIRTRWKETVTRRRT